MASINYDQKLLNGTESNACSIASVSTIYRSRAGGFSTTNREVTFSHVVPLVNKIGVVRFGKSLQAEPRLPLMTYGRSITLSLRNWYDYAEHEDSRCPPRPLGGLPASMCSRLGVLEPISTRGLGIAQRPTASATTGWADDTAARRDNVTKPPPRGGHHLAALGVDDTSRRSPNNLATANQPTVPFRHNAAQITGLRLGKWDLFGYGHVSRDFFFHFLYKVGRLAPFGQFFGPLQGGLFLVEIK